MVTVEIVAVGNELLLGIVQDTNTNYLCRVVRGLGGRVRHAAIVRDEETDIVAEIRGSISREADLIFTCGGLGPTDDDLTLSAVAHVVGCTLAIDEDARNFVERRYRELADSGYVAKAVMDESRMKMATIPEGSKMIANPVGAAPAVLTELDRVKIVALPGVPAELKGIVEGPLQPLLGSVFGAGAYLEREILADCGDESVLALLLRPVAQAHPDVYIKSRASHFGPDVKFRVLLSATGSDTAQAENRTRKAEADLTIALERSGIRVSRGEDLK